MRKTSRFEGPDRSADWERTTADTLAALAEDAGKARPLVRRVIGKLAECLSEPGLNVTGLLGKCGLTRAAVAIPFRIDTRQSLSAYIKTTYLEVALAFLTHTRASLKIAGGLAGFSNFRQLKRTVESLLGISAEELELRAWLVGEASSRGIALYSRRLWRELRQGKLDPSRAQEIWERLQWLYPEAARSWGSESGTAESAGDSLISGALMESLWELLQTLPPSDRRELLRHSSCCGSASFFHFLCEKSLEASRAEPERGVEIMATALEILRAGATQLDSDFPALEALGLARLGNARRLASDMGNARRDLAKAQVVLKGVGKKDDLIEAEILSYQATLHLSQGELAASRELLDRGIALCEGKSHCRLLAQCLIQRASVLAYAGDPVDALPDLDSALEVLADQAEPRLKLLVCSNLATARALAGRFDEAEKNLAQGLERCTELGDRVLYQHLCWTQGLIHHGRGELDDAAAAYENAMRGFTAVGQPGYVAMASLELALVRDEQGWFEDAAALAAAAIPVLEHFQHVSGVTAALRTLNEAMAGQEVPRRVLEEVRRTLHVLWRDPTADLAAVRA